MSAGIDALIHETERWIRYHQQIGRKGQVEALAGSIRLRALKDAKAVIDGQPLGTGWSKNNGNP